jgi:hypothetical protein
LRVTSAVWEIAAKAVVQLRFALRESTRPFVHDRGVNDFTIGKETSQAKEPVPAFPSQQL